VKPLAALCALLAVLVAAAAPADAARKHARPFCKPANSRVLKQTKSVRILYVQHPGQEDLYGIPATVYACFPAHRRRTKLFDVSSSEVWTPKVTALNDRFFAFAATTEDVVCEKYQQPDCTGAYVADFRVSSGALRCSANVFASALALTSNGWIAWLSGAAPGQPATLSACDSAGIQTLDQGAIDAASVQASGALVEWQRDGQPQSAALR
jgi:hypothetical protein